MQRFKEEFEKLCAEGDVAGPVSEDDIRRAERQLGVVFPEEYRDFLANKGALSASGVQLYGLPDPVKNDPPLWQDVVSATTKLRTQRQIGTEDPYMVPFAHDGFSTYFFFDTQLSPATRILAIGPDVEKVVSDNLYKFAIDYVEGNVGI